MGGWTAGFESQSEGDFDSGDEYFGEDCKDCEDKKEEASAKGGGNGGE